jgi:type VI secretion system protein
VRQEALAYEVKDPALGWEVEHVPLSLTLVSARQGPPGTPASRVLTSGRLTIGRSAANDWMLPDPERVVSKHHCVIEGSDETFRLVDSSVNGVFINEADQPVGADKTYLLRHGDRIRIGSYEIDVAIESSAAAARASRPVLSEETSFDAPLSSAVALFGRGPEPLRIPEDEPLFPSPNRADKRHHLTDLDGGPPTDEAFAPPRPAAQAPPAPQAAPLPDPCELPPEPSEESDKSRSQAIPTEWDPFAAPVSRNDSMPPRPADTAPATAPDPQSVAISPTPPAAPAQPQRQAQPQPQPKPDIAGEDRLVRAFLAGAGVEPDSGLAQIDDTERMMREVGEIFRIVVAGLIAVLESRRALKREVGVAATEFQRTENNPLKFTLGVDDTVRILLTGGERGYLPPAQAFEEAFADIKQHQVAVLAGMQEAWMDLLRRLDPKALEHRLGEDGGLGGLLSSKKARCWDAFTQLYDTIANDAQTDYKSLFSRVFSYAYEKHLNAASEKRR